MLSVVLGACIEKVYAAKGTVSVTGSETEYPPEPFNHHEHGQFCCYLIAV